MDETTVAAAKILSDPRLKGEAISPEIREKLASFQDRPALLRAIEQQDFLSYLDMAAEQGVSLGKWGIAEKDKDTNLGYLGTYLYWSVELLIAAGTAYLFTRSAVLHPFCASCQAWKSEQPLGGLDRPVKSVVRAIQKGELSQLAAYNPRRADAELLVSAFVCPRCGTAAPVEVRVQQRKSEKERKAELKKLAVANLWMYLSLRSSGTELEQLALVTYPGESLEAWQALFDSQPSEEPC